jgi:hypothetical protein
LCRSCFQKQQGKSPSSQVASAPLN